MSANGMALEEMRARNGRPTAPPLRVRGGALISLAPAGRPGRRAALITLGVSALFFLAAVPFAKQPLTPVPAFIPAYQSALVVNDLVTAILLFGQFSILRSRAMLLLASGYLFTAFMTVIHALTFPGLFAPGGLLGAGPQTTAWLYMFWHGGFPLLAMLYALDKHRPRTMKLRPGLAIGGAVLGAAAAAGGLALLATAGQALLPGIMEGNRYTAAMITVVSAVWALSLAALVVLWHRRPHSILDLWLMVVMCAWMFDIALAAVLNAGRFDLGFYAGRIYGLLAATFVLVVLLLENSVLYARLAKAYAGEQRERKRAEERTAELDAANQELDAFSYSVSHDLRTPLRTVNGYARMLAEDYGPRLDDEGRRLLGMVGDAGAHMNRLIDDLLEFSRFSRAPLAKAPVEMKTLAGEAAARARGESRARLELDELPAASGDRALLMQVWLNFLLNAFKYSSKREQPVIEIGGKAEGAEHVYWVRDNGAGFDMRYAQKLYGVFQRLHRAEEFPGTGVGLAIVQRVVARHGGRVWAEGKVGEGACFYFSLPRGER
jgi:signal transduction histidine kinase